MLHLAMKAFYPAKLPFPLLHVDTTWKFREMIAFRDETAKRLGLDLHVHINARRGEDGDQSIHARLDGSHRRDEDPGAQAGARHLRIRLRVRRRPARRRAFARQGAGVLDPLGTPPVGPQAAAARALAPVQHPQTQGREPAGVSAVELDRARCVALRPPREHSGGAALLREAATGRATRRRLDPRRRRPHAARAGRNARDARGAVSNARLLSAERSKPHLAHLGRLARLDRHAVVVDQDPGAVATHDRSRLREGQRTTGMFSRWM